MEKKKQRINNANENSLRKKFTTWLKSEIILKKTFATG